MSSRLLDQALSQSGRPDRRQQQSSGADSRNSPYSRNSRASDGAWKHDMYDPHSARSGPRGRGRNQRSGDATVLANAAGDLRPSAKLLVDNLHYEVTERELQDLFSQHGPLVKAFIRFDKSGRSKGQAVVIYESVDDATVAKNEFDGAKAKGQVITITQEMRSDRPAGKSQAGDKGLLSRFDLLSRMGESRPQPPSNAPRGPSAAGRAGPHRNVSGSGQAGHGREKREKRKPATAEELDAELEAFMKTPAGKTSTADSVHAPAVEDVDMA